jgi:predicted RNA binding protein YcfA (HicA-like mRNA interferase family)
MSYVVDFQDVSTVGLESSPVAEALAGLRANEARYFHTKYKHEYVTVPAAEAQDVVDWVHNILKTERDIVIDSPVLEVADIEVDGIKWPELYYQSGLVINVLWTLEDGGTRAVGFKLSEGMDVPAELEAAGFKFARQKSKLAGTIRGSFFVIKGSY